jgi:hypothetical protein
MAIMNSVRKLISRFGQAGEKGSRFRRFGAAGPYMLVLLLPGGSIIALLMYAYQLKRAES